MTILPVTSSQPARTDWTTLAIRVGGLVLVTALSILILSSWELVERVGAYGYPAVFVISLLSSTTLFFPAPGLALVVSMGTTLDPMMIGLVAGLGAALGEMTAYIAGYCGTNIIEDKALYREEIRGPQFLERMPE